MNKRKVIGVIVIIGLLLIGCAVAFFMNRTTYTLNLPEADDLKSISLSNPNKEEEVTDIKEIEDMLYVLKENGRTTKKESINDSPVNTEEPIKVELNLKKEGSSVVYIYEDDGKYYLEQPYNGIYQISGDEYNDIAKYFQ